MSRIGKQPVVWASGTKVSLKGSTVRVEAGKTVLEQDVDACISVAIDESGRSVQLTRADDTKRSRAMHGLYRSLVANMVEGAEKGFKKTLDIHGVGYNAKLSGKTVVLNIGFNVMAQLELNSHGRAGKAGLLERNLRAGIRPAPGLSRITSLHLFLAVARVVVQLQVSDGYKRVRRLTDTKRQP